MKTTSLVLVLVLRFHVSRSDVSPTNLCRFEGAVLQQVNGHDDITGVPGDPGPLLGRLAGVELQRLLHVLGVSGSDVGPNAASKAGDL